MVVEEVVASGAAAAGRRAGRAAVKVEEVWVERSRAAAVAAWAVAAWVAWVAWVEEVGTR